MIQQATLAKAVDYIDQWLAWRFAGLDIPGMVVAVRHKNKLIYQQAFGSADLESSTPMTTGHIFRIASQSKMFTATAIMQLQEQGKLRLDDRAATYIPWLNEHTDARWQQVTLRQLLSHSAGVIRDGLDSDYWELRRPFPDAETFKKELLQAALVFDNNTRFKYSNYGYTLLGLVISAVSGEPYNTYIQQHIIGPLQLKHTGPELTGKQGRHATGYSRKTAGRRLPMGAIITHAMSPATGFYATAEDMCAFAAAHFSQSNSLLQAESRKEMQRLQWSSVRGDQQDDYGLGFAIDSVDSQRLVGHGGAFPGQTSKTLIDPEKSIAVAVLTNCIDAPNTAIAKGIYHVLHWFLTHSNEKSAHDLYRFTGRFLAIWGTADIVAAGNTIVCADPDNWRPFDTPDVLSYINDTTLKIEQAGGYGSPGELIHFTFRGNQPASIINAGITMLPEQAFLAELQPKTSLAITN